MRYFRIGDDSSLRQFTVEELSQEECAAVLGKAATANPGVYPHWGVWYVVSQAVILDSPITDNCVPPIPCDYCGN